MKKKTTSKDILRLFWQASVPYRGRRNLALLFAAVTFAVSMFIGPLVIAQLLTAIQTHQLSQTSALWGLVGLYTASQVWSEIIGWRLVLYFVWTFETAMQRDLYTKSFDKLVYQTMFFHSSKFGGSLVSQTNKLTGAVEQFWDSIIWSVLPLAISLIGSIAVLSTLLWQYALFLALFAILFGVVVYFGSRPMATLNEKEASANNAVSGRLADVVSNILAVKSSSGERQEQAEFAAITNRWRQASLGTMRGFLKVSSVYSTITTVIKIAAIAFAIYASQHQIVSVAAVYLIITYTGNYGT